MRAHSKDISATEFLSKSLAAAGVFLALPAAFSVYVGTYVLWLSWPWRHFPFYLIGWLGFCTIGFSLLWRTARFVRSPETIRRPRLLWFSISVFLGIFLAACITWVVVEYHYARYYQTISPEASPVGLADLLLPGIVLLVPAWALALSTALAIRRQGA
jgi:hypothetical protein